MKLTVPDRIALFAEVCLAVQHDHQKGIMHRDLKPSNILVHLQDGKPAPKIIDFGLAKAMGQQLTENTIFTSSGSLVGTPIYMSPEQADRRSVDVEFKNQPLVDAALRQSLADLYRKLGLFEPSALLQEEALKTRIRELGTEHLETIASQASQGILLRMQGRLEEAETY